MTKIKRIFVDFLETLHLCGKKIFKEVILMRMLHFFPILLVLVVLHSSLVADDGMWMPHQMKMLNLENEGLKMNPDDLYKEDGTGLMSAVVNLGGGTGSFVSEKGLILTNHHVAFGALQRASDPEHNYLQEGFLAKSYSEEIPAPGNVARVLISYNNVTDQIDKELKGDMASLERYNAIDRAKKKIIKEAESRGPDLYASIASAYSGNQYYLYLFKNIKDVRIAYAPPRDLGNFGGEVDNWMWPRHTCDFTFLRAYVSPDGLGADYSPDNVPYEPKVQFKIAKDDLKDGDFTFIMGYPGKTYRNFSTPELVFDIELLENSIKERLEYIDFFENSSKKNEAVEIKYAGMLKGLYNGLKNFRGKLEGFNKADLVNVKKEMDRKYQQWAQQDNISTKKYATIVDKINNYFESEYKDFYWKNRAVTTLTSYYRGPAVLSQAYLIVRIALESQKPDMERDFSYQERNMHRLIRRIKLAERGYDPEVDKEYTVLRLQKLADQPKDRLPGFMYPIIEKPGGITSWVTTAFEKTKLTDPEYRLLLIKKSPDELKALKDPMIDLAFEIENEESKLRHREHTISQKKSDLKKIYIKGLLEMHESRLAADANSTIRFTYGPVKGYAPRDAVYYEPFTTLKGVIDKDSGESPFNVPEKIKTLHKEKDFGKYKVEELGDVPACFLNITNVTGGNSGSPTIDANGDVCGLVFDMTYESVIGDYYIIPEFQRVISVDIRYILFVTDKFSGATHLIEEMGLKD
jgi:hypothetical protein